MSWSRETGPATPSGRKHADTLRRRLTPPERRLWWHLRHTLALSGSHFRRQVAIGSYIVDFCCLTHRLVVEVDGEQHGSDEGRLRDEARTRELGKLGFRFIRFSNREVMTETTVVLDTILAALALTPPTPDPSPRGGGERVEDAA